MRNNNRDWKKIWIGCLVVWLGMAGSLRAFAPNTPVISLATVCTPHWVRPVDAAAGDQPDHFYPYGSTGQGQYQVHHGVEFVNSLGTPVFAVAGGTVVVAGTDRQTAWGRHRDYYGQLVILELDERCYGRPVYVLYGHLVAVQVGVGQRVEQGEVIGRVGMSGIAVGPHLHFEVRLGLNTFEHTQNPVLWFDPLPGCGMLVGRVVDAARQPLEGVLITIHRAEQPDRYWRETWTYTGVRRERLNSDTRWHENWTLSDLPAGEYILRLRVGDRLYTRRVSVGDGQTVFVQFDLPAPNLPKQDAHGIMLSP